MEGSQVYDRAEYAKRDFWNDRFTESQGYFDWYAGWKELKSTFEQAFGKEEGKQWSFLMVGCGNSKLSEEMAKDGYE